MSWEQNVAAEVAARYGVKVDPTVVQRVPRGASGYALPVFDGHHLIYPDADRRKNEKTRAFFRARRVGGAVSPEVLARRQKVQALHYEGYPVRDIAAGLSMNEFTVRQDLAKLGLKPNPIPTPPKVEKPKPVKAARAPRAKKESARPSMKAIGQERREELRAVIEAGLTRSQAAQKMGLSLWAIDHHAKLLGMKLARQQRPHERTGNVVVQAKRRDLVPALHAQGLSCAEMAEQLGCRPRAINLDLKALGLPFPKPRRDHLGPDPEKVAARRAQLRELLPLGLSVSEIARRLRVDFRTVYADLKADGLTLPKVARRQRGRQAEARVVERRDAVTAMVAEGRNRRQIEAALSITPEILAHDLRFLGLTLPRMDPRHGKVPQIKREAADAKQQRADRRERVIALRHEGLPIGEIAEKVGVGVSTVTEYLRLAGISGRKGGVGPRRHRSRDPEVVERVRKLFREGLSMSYIARRMSLSQPAVHRIVAEAAA